jgi:hypothetical protein
MAGSLLGVSCAVVVVDSAKTGIERACERADRVLIEGGECGDLYGRQLATLRDELVKECLGAVLELPTQLRIRG